jgi:hypothetical protein
LQISNTVNSKKQLLLATNTQTSVTTVEAGFQSALDGTACDDKDAVELHHRK